MGGLDGAVLVRFAAIVAARAHAVVAAQRLIALGQVGLLVDGQIAEGRRQAVGTVLAGGTAQPPQGVLQPFGQGREALAAEDDLGVFPAAAGEAEVIEAMVERHAGESDTELAGVGEVRQPHPPRRMLLREEHLLVGAMSGAPAAHTPLQCPTHGVRDPLATAAVLQLLEDRDGTQAGIGLEHRYDDLIPQPGQGIRAGTPMARHLALRR